MSLREANITSAIKDLDLSNSELVVLENLDAEASTPLAVPAVRANRFTYTDMPKAWIQEAEATVERIHSRLRGSVIDTGRDLLNIKDKLPHGQFGKWLAHYFHMSERTAQNCMAAAREFGATPQILDMVPEGTVYKLAAKATPDAVRQAVIDQIVAGTKPAPEELEKLIAGGKAVERQKKLEERKPGLGEKGECLAQLRRQRI